MQFDGTESSARAIAAWLERETKIIDGMLFSVNRDPAGSLLLHGGHGCWILRRHDGSRRDAARRD